MKRWMLLAGLGAAIAAAVLLQNFSTGADKADKADKAAETNFARTTIDLGMVVGDIDKSVAFYKEVIGFQEAPGFKVPGDFAKDVGLTNGKPLDIKVLVLGDGDSATKLKLMQVAGVESKKSDNEYIHSQLGVRYLTIFVKDTSAAVARLEKNKVKPIAKGTQPLPEGLPKDTFLTIVRDPDGNFVELVGAKK